MKIKYILLFILMLIPINTLALENQNTVTLSKCSDEGSARFLYGKEEIKVKFIGIEVEDFIKGTELDEIDEVSISDYVCSSLTNAKEIKLEFEKDINNKDKYGRVLAWVFVDGNLLQENLVEKGYAKVAYLYDDYKYSDVIKEKEKIAKENKVGLWSETEVEEVAPEKEKKKGIFGFFSNVFESIVDFFGDLINNKF